MFFTSTLYINRVPPVCISSRNTSSRIFANTFWRRGHLSISPFVTSSPLALHVFLFSSLYVNAA